MDHHPERFQFGSVLRVRAAWTTRDRTCVSHCRVQAALLPRYLHQPETVRADELLKQTGLDILPNGKDVDDMAGTLKVAPVDVPLVVIHLDVALVQQPHPASVAALPAVDRRQPAW